MKVLFLQENGMFDSLSVAQIAGALKADGHECSLLLASHSRDLLSDIRSAEPDILACSVLYVGHVFFERVLPAVKKALPRLPVLIGGPLLDVMPQFMENDFVDYSIRGEGDEAAAELLRALSSGGGLDGIKNLSCRKNGTLTHNPEHPVVGDLDSLPFPDRDLFFRMHKMGRIPVKRFVTGRGCPYQCKFCSHKTSRSLRPDSPPGLRKQSPARAVAEIRAVMGRYPLKHIVFADDVFFTQKAWLEEFSDRYRLEVGLPYSMSVTARQIQDDGVAEMLKRSGCIVVGMGLETGDEVVRRGILGKPVSDGDLERAVGLLKQHGITPVTCNMLALPGEDVEGAAKTLLINARLGVGHARRNIAVPVPETEMFREALKNGHISKDYSFSGCRLPEGKPHYIVKNSRQIQTLYFLFSFLAQFPRLARAWRLWVKIPPVGPVRFFGAHFANYMEVRRLKIGMADALSILATSYREYGRAFSLNHLWKDAPALDYGGALPGPGRKAGRGLGAQLGEKSGKAG